MKYLILAFAFYYQNLLFSFVYSYEFVPEIFEFLFITSLVFFMARFKLRKLIYILWQLLYTVQFCFYGYFNSWIISYDIKLFYTHINETFESIIVLLSYFSVAISTGIIIILFILSNHFKSIIINKFILFIIIIFTFSNTKINDVSLLLIKELPYTFTFVDSKINNNIPEHKLIKETNQSIVLILGESHRAKEYLDHNFSFFQNNYQSIYSAATNTDVSLPLFFNGIENIEQINTTNNLFKLAKQNHYKTFFISSQKQSYLKYIEPFVEKKFIDEYQILSSQNDYHLIDKIKKIDLSKKSFVVLQMQGVHSPYIYHNETQSDNIKEQYYKCYQKSNNVLEQLKKVVNKNAIIIFTSDHGENLGENNKYGHNRFSPEIYKVPLVILNDKNKTEILSHYELYLHIVKQLGYDISKIKKKQKIRVYGTMINGEDGFRDFLR